MPHHREALALVLGDEGRDPGLARMGHRPAELLERHLLAGHRLDHVRPGDEHVRGLADHEREVRDRRRVDGTARARPHDHADLRDHARGPDVALEHVAVAGEARRPLLDPCSARVVDRDERGARRHREVHDLADLLRVDLPERPAEDREVLAGDEDAPAVDGPVARDDAVAGGAIAIHAEVVRAMDRERVGLLERVAIEQQLDPLASGELALLVLLADGVLASRVQERGPPPPELFDPFDDGLGRGVVRRTLLGGRHRPRSLAPDPRRPVRRGQQSSTPAQGPHPSAFTIRIVTMAFVLPESALSSRPQDALVQAS